MRNEKLKILSVGNSFSDDTMKLLPDIAKNLGITEFRFSNLYIGGCSINRHYNNVINDVHGYKYYTNQGEGWETVDNYSIDQAVKDEHWDIISIQHGTGDKSRYTSPECYDNLVPLINHVKAIAHNTPKIAFNMTWIGEPDHTHHELVSYGGDQIFMYNKVTELTKTLIAPLAEIDVVSPTGTAIQNARGCLTKRLTRDGYHLSLDLGRYIASLTFIKALCNTNIDLITWAPGGVTEQEKEIAIKAANAAINTPYSISVL